MHHIYSTEAFVVRSRPAREASRVYELLTRELGLVRAHAQGVRLAASKLRGHLEPFSHSDVSLVKGREYWRLTGASERRGRPARGDERSLRLLKNVFDLVARLVHGEEKNERLFSVVSALADYLPDHALSAEEARDLEALTVMRILSSLGYAAASGELAPFAGESGLSPEIVASFHPHRAEAVRRINAALRETHL